MFADCRCSRFQRCQGNPVFPCVLVFTILKFITFVVFLDPLYPSVGPMELALIFENQMSGSKIGQNGPNPGFSGIFSTLNHWISLMSSSNWWLFHPQKIIWSKLGPFWTCLKIIFVSKLFFSTFTPISFYFAHCDIQHTTMISCWYWRFHSS